MHDLDPVSISRRWASGKFRVFRFVRLQLFAFSFTLSQFRGVSGVVVAKSSKKSGKQTRTLVSG